MMCSIREWSRRNARNINKERLLEASTNTNFITLSYELMELMKVCDYLRSKSLLWVLWFNWLTVLTECITFEPSHVKNNSLGLR